jgi:aspartyl-tRNA(Asn)/glutamyl-tRNA(Gln) amidotransferase subunit B
MNLPQEKYETVIGLEVHAQLNTQTKLFAADPIAYGAAPNTQISAITLGYPGTLPKLNEKAVQLAIKLGLACHCAIEPTNYFARKHYFYPDLPKGYQTSQHTTPICKGGYVSIATETGTIQIPLNRIHLEEDAGKSIHDIDPDDTCLDYNRAGTPLVEIVTEPAIHRAADAATYVTELRKLVRWLAVCDGNMEEGSLRCDANVSIRPKGSTTLGTKVEIKNLNSIRNLRKAIEIEVDRMIELAEAGKPITQETRGFDADQEITFSLRSKEEANDYRYFPCPDLPPFDVTPEQIAAIQASMPVLPEQMMEQLQIKLGLSAYDATQICEDPAIILYFETLLQHHIAAKPAANWINGPIKSWLNDHQIGIESFDMLPSRLAELIQLVMDNLVSFSTAASRVLPAMIKNKELSAQETAASLNLLQESDHAAIESWVDEVLRRMPDKVVEYQKGKKGLIGLFMGEVKKISKGKADPQMATALLQKKLNA